MTIRFIDIHPQVLRDVSFDIREGDTASMFVPILILMFVGVALTSIVRKVEDLFAPWRAHDE